MRLLPLELDLYNMRSKGRRGRRGYCPPEIAYENLKKQTGQDFGWDFDKWEEWIKQYYEKKSLEPEITPGLEIHDETLIALKEAIEKHGHNVFREAGINLNVLRGMSAKEFEARIHETFGDDK